MKRLGKMISGGADGGITAWKILKIIFFYFTLWVFVVWVQSIILLLLYPIGGGVFHTLLQLHEWTAVKTFILKIYRHYLLVGVCTAFVLSLLKRKPNPLAMGFIAIIVPAIYWIKICLFVMGTSLWPLTLLLSSLHSIAVFAASLLGWMVRKLITRLYAKR